MYIYEYDYILNILFFFFKSFNIFFKCFCKRLKIVIVSVFQIMNWPRYSNSTKRHHLVGTWKTTSLHKETQNGLCLFIAKHQAYQT